MYQYLKHNEINKTWWDECIHLSEQGTIFSLSAYLDSVAPGWHGIVKVSHEGYEQVVPVPVLKKMGLFSYVQQPVYTPFYTIAKKSADPVNYKALAELLQCKIKAVSGFKLLTGPDELQNAAFPHQLVYKEFVNTLFLGSSYQQIRSLYSRLANRMLDKAQVYRIETADDILILVDLFKANTAHKIYAMDTYFYEVLKKLYCNLQVKGYTRLYVAKDSKGTIEAAALYLMYKKQSHALVVSHTEQARQNGAGYLMIDYFIKHNQQKNLTLYLGGGNNVPHINSFHEKFGISKTPLQVLSYNHLPLSIRLLQNTRQKLYKWLVK